jgi:restriction system protein
MDLNLELDTLLAELPEINQERKYWLVRTQSGDFYDTFLQNNFISVGYNKIPLAKLDDLSTGVSDRQIFVSQFKAIIKEYYPDEKRPGAIANQVTKFIYDIAKDDIVIIPSTNSSIISIGRVVENGIRLADAEEMRRTDCDNKFRRRTEWIKTLSRRQLDPYLYKVLFAHKAINNLDKYADFIERTISNFYIKQDDINLVLYVNKQVDINAKDLFSLGYFLLETLDKVSAALNLDISSEDIDLKINLNSEGKIQFIGKHLKAGSAKAVKAAKSIVVLGVITIFINGGGVDKGDFHMHTDGIVKSITDYLNSSHDRQVQDQLLKKYMDNLQVSSPDDLLKLMKQTSINKDIPK